MSVPLSLLAILDQGPCYGNQLRAEMERRTGGLWKINVGQIYRTLERLERGGDVSRGAPDDAGHVYWTITEPGRRRVRAWLRSPVPADETVRDDVVTKIALALTLPGTDADALLDIQHPETLARVAQLRASLTRPDPGDAAALASRVLQEARLESAEAELRWLEHLRERLQRPRPPALELSTLPPRRGRPPAGGATPVRTDELTANRRRAGAPRS